MIDLHNLVAAAIEGDATTKDRLAKDLVSLAVLIVGRVDGVSFNKEKVSLTLTSGTAEYQFGVDLLPDYDRVIGLSEVWHTDTAIADILVVGEEDFNVRTAGSSRTGRPVLATMYQKGDIPTMKVFPTPDQDYTVNASVKLQVTKLDEIPENYHDTVYTQAIELAHALNNGSMASKMADYSMKGLISSGETEWNGSVIKVARPLAQRGRGLTPDSGNLRP